MIYNQTKVNGMSMPLLMGCTKPSAIEIAEEEIVFTYDSITQVSNYECLRPVGTKSLKTQNTQKGIGKYATDKKNEIDDKKYV